VDGHELRRKVADMLLDKMRDENFPSVTMMNRVEAVIGQDPDELSEYAEMLLEKVEATRYPSVEMLERLDRIAAQLA
jgi:hypothetical protein